MKELSRTELLRVIEEFKSERDAAKASVMRAFDERDIALNENASLRTECAALRAAAEAREKEAYERAAQVCEGIAAECVESDDMMMNGFRAGSAMLCAAAIRALAEQQPITTQTITGEGDDVTGN